MNHFFFFSIATFSVSKITEWSLTWRNIPPILIYLLLFIYLIILTVLIKFLCTCDLIRSRKVREFSDLLLFRTVKATITQGYILFIVVGASIHAVSSSCLSFLFLSLPMLICHSHSISYLKLIFFPAANRRGGM